MITSLTEAPPAPPLRFAAPEGDVARTLLVPLWARAEEQRQPRPLVVDPWACAMVAAFDYDFGVLREAQASQLGCCVRAAQIDRWVRDFLRRHPDGTVIELGVGLNSRSARLDNQRARWVDVDLPEVIALRRAFFPDTARRTTLAMSITEPALYRQLAALSAHGPRLVLSEGVLVYLPPAEVRAVFDQLAHALAGAEVIFDLMRPPVLWCQRGHDAMRHFEAKFVWSEWSEAAVRGFAPTLTLATEVSFYSLLYAHPERLPRWMRWLGPRLAGRFPDVRSLYTVLRGRFAA